MKTIDFEIVFCLHTTPFDLIKISQIFEFSTLKSNMNICKMIYKMWGSTRGLG